MNDPYETGITIVATKRLPGRAFKPIAWAVLLLNILSLLVVVAGLVWMFAAGKVGGRTLSLAAAFAALISGGMLFTFFYYPALFVAFHVLATSVGAVLTLLDGFDKVSWGIALLNLTLAALLTMSYFWKRPIENRASRIPPAIPPPPA